MRQHDDPIIGQVQISLESVRADGDSAAEGGHGVLRVSRLVPAVGDGLREAADIPPWDCLGEWSCLGGSAQPGKAT